VRERVLDLLRARLGLCKVRRQHRHDHARRLDPGEHLRVPVRSLADVLEIDPDVLATRLEGVGERAHRLLVAPRVGEEDVGALGFRRGRAPGARARRVGTPS